MKIYTQNLWVCNSGQYIYVTGLCNFFVLQDVIDRINPYFQGITFQRNLLLRPHVVDLSFIVIFYAKTSMLYALIIYFSRFAKKFLCYFFQKQAWKDHSTQENILQATLLNEKQSSLEKEMYENISLYSQYFSHGAGNNVHKTYFYYLKLTKNILFYLLRSKKLNIKQKIYTCNTHYRMKLSLHRSKLFYIQFQRNVIETIFPNHFHLN